MSAYREPATIEPNKPGMIPVHACGSCCPKCGSFMQARLYAQEGRYSYFVCNRPDDFPITKGCHHEWATDARWWDDLAPPPDGGALWIPSKATAWPPPIVRW